MRVYRITAPAHVGAALSGQGAAVAPGRWNSSGVRMGYTAGSVGVAMLELLVHIGRENVPGDRRLLTLEIPADAIEALAVLPDGWNRLPYTATVRRAGDDWIASGRSLAIRVPSAIARHEVNVLVNPSHPRFGEIALVDDEPLAFDSRLFD